MLPEADCSATRASGREKATDDKLKSREYNILIYDRGYKALSRRALLTIPILALPVSLGQAQSVAPGQFINILTATTGGVFYPLGGALKDVFAAKIPGSRPSVQATRGSFENLNILQSGKAEIAFTEGGKSGRGMGG